MRRYDEAIDVRRGLVSGREAPAQFVWRDRLWVVRDIVSHWTETGAWWEQPGVCALFGGGAIGGTGAGGGGGAGGGTGAGGGGGAGRRGDLLAEKELWRVEAARGREHEGVFDLAFDWTLGQWHLVGCAD